MSTTPYSADGLINGAKLKSSMTDDDDSPNDESSTSHALEFSVSRNRHVIL
jgi:hypothetical protein